MLRVASEIAGYTLLTQDGEIGQCDDFLFDDRTWVVRYIVAKTAKWLPGRKVIISPVFVQQPDSRDGHLPLRLTREQIEQSPPLDEHAPVSRQYEINYHRYYTLPFYWLGHELSAARPDSEGVLHPKDSQPPEKVRDVEAKEGHLRSINEVTGYHIAGIDDDVGHIEGFLVEDKTWALRYLLVATRNWLPARKVLISPQWLESVSWVEQKVYVDLDTDAIKNSPEFDPALPVKRRYETVLHDYYRRPYYWK